MFLSTYRRSANEVPGCHRSNCLSLELCCKSVVVYGDGAFVLPKGESLCWVAKVAEPLPDTKLTERSS